jgi:hypothetical protein
MRFIQCILVCFLVPVCIQARIEFPQDNFVFGWKKTGQTRQFSEATLYQQINGAAELFKEFGFQSMIAQTYSFQEKEIMIELYRMEQPESALGIFMIKAAYGSPNPEVPVRNVMSNFQILATKGVFYLQIFNYSGDKAAASVMQRMARHILSQIQQTKIALLDLLPEAGLIRNSQRIIRGPLSQRSTLGFDLKSKINIAPDTFGVAAKYCLLHDSCFTQLIIPCKDAGECQAFIANINMQNDQIHEVVERSSDHITFKVAGIHWGMIRRQGDLLIVKINSPINP